MLALQILVGRTKSDLSIASVPNPSVSESEIEPMFFWFEKEAWFCVAISLAKSDVVPRFWQATNVLRKSSSCKWVEDSDLMPSCLLQRGRGVSGRECSTFDWNVRIGMRVPFQCSANARQCKV